MQVWMTLRKKSKIIKDAMVEYDENAPFDTAILNAMTDTLRQWDVPRPMVLSRHKADWDQFGRILFMKDHFVESFPFDVLELEAIIERKETNIDEYV